MSKIKILLGIIAAILALNVFIFRGIEPTDYSVSPDFASRGENADVRVILYATSWCPYCKKTRQFLHKNRIHYVEYDIEKSAEGRRQYQQLGGRGVPVLNIDGKVVHGYNVQVMSQLLDL